MEEITQIAPTYFGFNGDSKRKQTFVLSTDEGNYLMETTLHKEIEGFNIDSGRTFYYSENTERQVSESEKSWVIDYIKENLVIV